MSVTALLKGAPSQPPDTVILVAETGFGVGVGGRLLKPDKALG